MMSLTGYAGQCSVEVHNELRTHGNQIEIHTDDGQVAQLASDNSVRINGQPVALNEEQKRAVAQYRSDLTSGIQQARAYSGEAIIFLNNLLDDMAGSLDSPQAFHAVKQKLNAFWQQTSAQYLDEHGNVVIPKGSLDHLMMTWKKARSLFDDEFLTSLWNTLSVKMKDKNGINLSAMASAMDEIKSKLKARWHEHDVQRHRKEKALCDSMHQLIKEEQDLHQQIPELKNYPLLTI